MRIFRLTTLLLLLSVLAQAYGQGVPFRSGKCYEIRCVELLQGSVQPSPADPLALVHSTSFSGKSALWRITKQKNGYYTIRHEETGLYMTYDGQRTATRRYMRLTPDVDGTNSFWRIYPGSTQIVIANVRSNYVLNVRRSSHIVGLYRNPSSTATSNERFVLVDKDGKQVVEMEGKKVNARLNENPSGGRMPVSRKGTSALHRAGQMDFTVNGKKAVYDSRKNVYLFSLPEKQMGKEVHLRFASHSHPDASFSVDGGVPVRKRHASFGAVSGGRTYRLALVENGDTLSVAHLQFTYLPIVELSAGPFSKSAWGDGQMTMHDGTSDSCYIVQVRNRGDYTLNFSKRSMAVKLKNAQGKKINRCLLGLRTDNYWILDAMTVDPARMRGRVAMDLWHDFAAADDFRKLSKNACHASRGRLVEVFLNGRYHGVYNLCERIDRKQLQLLKDNGKGQGGVLYKADQWSSAILFGGVRRQESFGRPDDSRENWEGWQAKYPEPSRKRKAHWQPLYDAVRFVCRADNETFCQEVDRYFVLPLVRDYWLFVELLLATDNSGKNMYWTSQDCQRTPQLAPIPWDLDGTWGRDWSGRSVGCGAERNYREFLSSRQNGLFERLYRLNPHDWNKNMAQRYGELRQEWFQTQKLRHRFETYLHLLEQSGADKREEERWTAPQGGKLHLRQEVERICQWIEQRMAYLDKQYGCDR